MIGLLIGVAVVLMVLLLVCWWALRCYRDFQKRLEAVRRACRNHCLDDPPP